MAAGGHLEMSFMNNFRFVTWNNPHITIMDRFGRV